MDVPMTMTTVEQALGFIKELANALMQVRQHIRTGLQHHAHGQCFGGAAVMSLVHDTCSRCKMLAEFS